MSLEGDKSFVREFVGIPAMQWSRAPRSFAEALGHDLRVSQVVVIGKGCWGLRFEGEKWLAEICVVCRPWVCCVGVVPG